MAPPLGEDVLGVFINLNQQAAKAAQLLYLGNNEVFSELLLEQFRSFSSKIERVLAMSNDPQILEKDTPTKRSIMVSIAAGIRIYQKNGILNDGRGRASVYTCYPTGKKRRSYETSGLPSSFDQ